MFHFDSPGLLHSGPFSFLPIIFWIDYQFCWPEVHLWLSPVDLTLSALTRTGSSNLSEGCILNSSYCLEELPYHSDGTPNSWKSSSWPLLHLTQGLWLTPARNPTSLGHKVVLIQATHLWVQTSSDANAVSESEMRAQKCLFSWASTLLDHTRNLAGCVYVCVCVLVAQSCLTLCDTLDCSPPGSSVHGILQAGILEWVAIPFSRRFSQLKNWTRVSCIVGRFCTIWDTRETPGLVYQLVIDQGKQRGYCLMGLNVKSRSTAAFTPWWYRFVEELLLIVYIACQAQYGTHISIILWSLTTAFMRRRS